MVQIPEDIEIGQRGYYRTTVIMDMGFATEPEVGLGEPFYLLFIIYYLLLIVITYII